MQLTTGQIVKSHGVRGDVVVDVRTDDPDDRFAVGNILSLRHTSGTISHHEVVAARWHQQRLLIRFADITTREAADSLRRCLIVIDSADIAEPDDPANDEYHVTTLIGMEAHSVEGDFMGTVTDVLTHTAQDLLVVTDADEKQHLIPFMQALVPAVEVAERRITLDLPAGLWEL